MTGINYLGWCYFLRDIWCHIQTLKAWLEIYWHYCLHKVRPFLDYLTCNFRTETFLLDDWLLSILKSLHASVCFDHLKCCWRFWVEQMSVYTTGCLIDYQLFFSLVMFSVIFFFHWSEPVQVVSHFWQSIEKRILTKL